MTESDMNALIRQRGVRPDEPVVDETGPAASLDPKVIGGAADGGKGLDSALPYREDMTALIREAFGRV